MSISKIADAAAQNYLALSIPQLIAQSGIGRTTIYAEIAAGRLRIRKIRKRTVVLYTDAMAWLNGEADVNASPDPEPRRAA